MFDPQPHRQEIYQVCYNLNEFADGLYIPAAYIVTLDQDGYLAHIKQRATADTVGSFGIELTEDRREAFSWIDDLQVKALEKRFSPPRRKQKLLQVLLEDPDIKKNIHLFVHRLLGKLLEMLVYKGAPITWNVERKVLVKDFLLHTHVDPLEPELSFTKTEDGVLYRLCLRNGEDTLLLSNHEVIPVTNHPAWVVIDDALYPIAHINGNMVKPFRQRDEVRIPEKQVKTYFQKFILKVAARLDIAAEGFDVVHYDTLEGCTLSVVDSPFDDTRRLLVEMIYPHAEFAWNNPREKRTNLEFEEEDVRIIQVRRDRDAEQQFLNKLDQLGLSPSHGATMELREQPDDNPLFMAEWLASHRKKLEQEGFAVAPSAIDEQTVYLHRPQLELNSEKENDWFDIYGQVTVGEFTFPFKKLAKYIRSDNRFFPLPNGTYFLIPQEWMNRYKSLMQFAQADGDQLKLSKSQFTLLEELGIGDETDVTEDLSEVELTLPGGLQAELRPYQIEGVKWLVQLYRNDLGACLADDMGLGKTLQTITVLLYAREQKKLQQANLVEQDVDRNGQAPQLDLFSQPAGDEDFLNPLQALIILPASLIFNWEEEIHKFAPELTICKHVGQKRQKDIRVLRRFDVILTTYQTALRDVDVLEEMEFEYIVLDESQQIKNRESKVFKAINRLQGRHKVSLSGTPIENSLSDLWSQMQFINPNLLGNYHFFKKEFITPIEKHQVEEKKERLRGLVAPYMLRRTKEEVARDLPPLTTKIFYSEMTREQKRLYEREKSAARNYLLENYDESNPRYRILVLQSLTKLRQIVNHPRLVRPEYERESGKFMDILEHWDVIRRSDHKALFFSSFVQYLKLFREEFDRRKQSYSWLTGDLPGEKRAAEIHRFERQKEVQSFLISIKSGGTGLNLTAADYVFILDPWWNPTTEQQAIARAHRIGQDKNVIAVKFITKDSIEEKILKLQERKARLAEDIIDNVRKPAFSRGDIEYLLD